MGMPTAKVKVIILHYFRKTKGGANLSCLKIATLNRLRTALMNVVKKTDFIGMGN